MQTREKTSEQLAKEIAGAILSMPLGGAAHNIEGMIGGVIEAVRCENIAPGLTVKGRERLPNGTLRLHCKDGFFIVPYFQDKALRAVNLLHLLCDFETMETAQVMAAINNKIAANG